MENLVEKYRQNPDSEYEIRYKVNEKTAKDFLKKLIKDNPKFEVNQSISLIKIVPQIEGGAELQVFTTPSEYEKYIKETKIFPSKRLNFTDDQILEMFEKLKKFVHYERIIKDVEFSINKIPGIDCKFENSYITIQSKPEDYDDFNQLSDMFQEEQRMKCLIYTEKDCPYDYFFKNVYKVAEQAQKEYNIITHYSVREALYKMVRECSSFRPNIMVFFIKMFDVKSVLDFSAGWGDRLIGCMSQDIEYTGVDPNKALHPGYQERIKFFGKTTDRYHMICDSFSLAGGQTL